MATPSFSKEKAHFVLVFGSCRVGYTGYVTMGYVGQLL